MIVATEDLPNLRRRVAMVDGGFDPLHPGHVVYFREAAALGAPVLCNISSDEYVAGKHPPFLTQPERTELVDAMRYVDYTHASRTSTEEVLRLLDPLYYVKGADWRGRLPEEELAVCAERGIEVLYLDTVVNSSTAILERYAAHGERFSRST